MVTYSSPIDAMPADYHDLLVKLVTQHMSAELAATELFGSAIALAPTAADKVRLAKFTKDESSHFYAVAKVAEGLGIDVDAWLQDHRPGGLRYGAESAEAADWVEVAMLHFVLDRQGHCQIETYADSSYRPWGATIGKILAEEVTHLRYGALEIERICRTDAGRARAQAHFTRWLPLAVKLFGRPNDPRDAFAVEVGLKNRRSADSQAAYLRGLKPIVDRCGLRWADFAAAEIELAPAARAIVGQ